MSQVSRWLVAFALASWSTPALEAHSGGLDEFGCHTNHATGGYHCHNSSTSRSLPRSPNGSALPSGRDESLRGGKSGRRPSRPAPQSGFSPRPTKPSSPVSARARAFEAAVKELRQAGHRRPLIGVRIIGVVDGDTAQFLKDGVVTNVRLDGIDAPELAQNFGEEAKAALSAYVLGKNVLLDKRSTDKYGRIVARLYYPGPHDASQSMVFSGYAWWFREYAPDDRRLMEWEGQARAERRGLWGRPPIEAPWDWRAAMRRHK